MKPEHLVTVTTLTVLGWATAYPKYENSDKDQTIVPWQPEIGTGSKADPSRTEDQNSDEGQNRPPRFGFPVYTQDVQATGNVLPGVYGPVRLDIGGLVLGTIVGLGAFFLLPKLFHVVPNPYPGYKRSEDLQENAGNSLSDIFSKVQESLDTFNVDSSACVQRAICSSLQAAGEKVGNHTANGLETIVDNIARNDILLSLLEGTDWKKAVTAGEVGESCSQKFPKCPNELVSVISAVSRYLVSSM